MLTRKMSFKKNKIAIQKNGIVIKVSRFVDASTNRTTPSCTYSCVAGDIAVEFPLQTQYRCTIRYAVSAHKRSRTAAISREANYAEARGAASALMVVRPVITTC